MPRPTFSSGGASLRGSRPRRCDRGFTMAEMLVVMAIITILAASLAVVIPKLRTQAMVKRAKADILGISHALELYQQDFSGTFPSAIFNNSSDPHADEVLYKALTDRNYNGDNVGWASANDEWGFITNASRAAKRLLDPWGLPYFYIAHTDYIHGVRIEDGVESMAPFGANEPNVFGATPKPGDHSGPQHEDPPSPPPPASEFYNPRSYQIHSKGPDQLTDVDDNEEEYIDALDRGTDDDDINNYEQ